MSRNDVPFVTFVVNLLISTVSLAESAFLSRAGLLIKNVKGNINFFVKTYTNLVKYNKVTSSIVCGYGHASMLCFRVLRAEVEACVQL